MGAADPILDPLRAVGRGLQLPLGGARRAGIGGAHRALAVVPACLLAIAGGLLGEGWIFLLALAWYGAASCIGLAMGLGVAHPPARFARRDSPGRLVVQGGLLGAALPIPLVALVSSAVAPSDLTEFGLLVSGLFAASALAG